MFPTDELHDFEREVLYLRGANLISSRYGGQYLGTVQGYRNLWLIAVCLTRITGYKIACSFCQSDIAQASRGRFRLVIETNILEQCKTALDVVEYFETWLGTKPKRKKATQEWENRVAI